MKIKKHKFKRVENFKYLGIILNEANNNQTDLQERIKNANKTYFMLQTFFKNKNISKKLQLTLKNITIDKTLVCMRNLDTNKERKRKQFQYF